MNARIVTWEPSAGGRSSCRLCQVRALSARSKERSIDASCTACLTRGRVIDSLPAHGVLGRDLCTQGFAGVAARNAPLPESDLFAVRFRRRAFAAACVAAGTLGVFTLLAYGWSSVVEYRMGHTVKVSAHSEQAIGNEDHGYFKP